MKRVVFAVAAAIIAFLLIGTPAGVVSMVDPDYCFDHEARPVSTAFHEERLSFLPPGPECRFTLRNGTVVAAGPGWWPAVTLGASLLSALVAFHLRSNQ